MKRKRRQHPEREASATPAVVCPDCGATTYDLQKHLQYDCNPSFGEVIDGQTDTESFNE
jgi:ribosomal protein L32